MFLQQVGNIELLKCPFCGGDYCGCIDCMRRKEFTNCKSCTIEFQRKFGKVPTKTQVKRAKTKLSKLGFWNNKKNKPVREAVTVPPVWTQKIGGTNYGR